MSKLKQVFWLLILVVVAGSAGRALDWLVRRLDRKYTATAYLDIACSCPTIIRLANPDKDYAAEFEQFCDIQKVLIKSRVVAEAALRDPKLKNRAYTLRQNAAHRTTDWLRDEIHVELAAKYSGIMMVSATERDPEDAAAIVNAVVEAYMTEIVDRDRQQRRDRLSELDKTTAEGEKELRAKRDELKREQDCVSGDEETAAVRARLAAGIYAEFQRQFQAMRAEHRTLLDKLQETKKALAGLATAEVPVAEVVALLATNPVYHELQSRLAFLSHFTGDGAPVPRQPSKIAKAKADFDSTKKQLQGLEQEAHKQVRDANRMALEQEVRRLESQVKITTEQLAAFEKEVERKGNDADSLARIVTAEPKLRAEVNNLERILRDVAEEREKLRIEVNSPSRVTVLGDRNCPALVPEKPD